METSGKTHVLPWKLITISLENGSNDGKNMNESEINCRATEKYVMHAGSAYLIVCVCQQGLTNPEVQRD